ncbi:MAG: class A beta-lactamase-related serine hydrolase [Chitinophagaceae bacterium]|nr:MAG: class A beta-lactamase-related serine hydrolase [Chitinophagaceae bacterium]
MPGSAFHYSLFGFNLAGAVLEKVTGVTYPQLVRAAVFNPLGMTHSYADGERSSNKWQSKYYETTGMENDLGDLSYKFPSGGMVSTCNDLLRFGNALIDGTILPKPWRDSMMLSQLTTSGSSTGYGMGWYTGVDIKGRTIWYHAGDSFTGSSGILIYPANRTVVTFLANSQAGTLADLEKIAGFFLP